LEAFAFDIWERRLRAALRLSLSALTLSRSVPRGRDRSVQWIAQCAHRLRKQTAA